MKKIYLTLSFAMFICACSHKEAALPPFNPSASKNLDFHCTHEADHLPQLDSRADQLFQYGHYLDRTFGPKDYNAIARYYRVAAAYGHYKANHNLQLIVSQGRADSPHRATETIDLAQQLIDQGIPGGYYDMGHYVELGYGVKKDQEVALHYFRKAADLGNPDAQNYLGKRLEPFNLAPQLAVKMWECAATQGHADAADNLGGHLKFERRYIDAMKAFQEGVAAGNAMSAFMLENSFLPPFAHDADLPPDQRLYYLALPVDFERSQRYRLIGEFIDSNDGRNPKVPDIDKIVPLPPAPLPAWDGTFQWKKEQQAAAPPPKPSEELIKQLCKEKNLDPATGLPLPPPPKVALGTRVKTGQVCPESGHWRVWDGKPVAYSSKQINKGEKMPPYEEYLPRWLEFLDEIFGYRYRYWDVEWELDDYA